MKQIVIIGGGNPDAIQLVQELFESDRQYQLIGILDDGKPVGTMVLGVPVLGPLDVWRDLDGTLCFAQSIVANPRTSRAIVQRLQIPHERFPNLIHPRASVFRSGPGAARMGYGNLALHGSSIQPAAVLGNFNYVNINSVIGHDAVVGDFNSFGVAAVVTGRCRVGHACYIGSCSVVTNGIAVDDECFICAGTVVSSKLKPGAKVLGNPPRMVPT
ncbi:MAG: acetyltransferase [Pirellulales bacterium]